MRMTQRDTLRLRDIFEVGFAARGESEWHREPGPGGRWDWHASAIGGCLRQQILTRAEARDDGVRLEGMLTFEVGHMAHRMLEEFCRAYAETNPSFRVVASEEGGHHPTLPLAARCDLIYSLGGRNWAMDLKTESANSGKHRRARATNGSAARPEHALQLAATVMVVEALGIVDRVEHGWILYLDKESGEFDEQPVAIDPLRQPVERRLDELEVAWSQYEAYGDLPDLLPPTVNRWGKLMPNGLCRARGDNDPRGYYCRRRSICMELESTRIESEVPI